MKSSLDTNILLRYIWHDVPGQREKAAALIDDTTQTFAISDLTISEIIFNLQIDHIKRSSIVEIINELAEKRNIKISPFIINTVLPYFAEHPALSFVDCYTAFEAEETHFEPLWTFDKKLAHQHPSAKQL